MKLKNVMAKLGAVILLIAVMAVNANAAIFNDVYLPVNFGERKISEAIKTGKGNPDVKVTNIKKGDGSSSSYSIIHCHVRSNGFAVSKNTMVTKGDFVTLTITDTSYKKMGTKIELWGNGNNSNLDCMVTGTFVPN